DGNINLRVQDHGIGIDPEHLSRIFGRFERAVSSRNYGGLGMGLYISRQIGEAHGGPISVKSKRGEGSGFTVELPKTPREHPLPEVARPSASPTLSDDRPQSFASSPPAPTTSGVLPSAPSLPIGVVVANAKLEAKANLRSRP